MWKYFTRINEDRGLYHPLSPENNRDSLEAEEKRGLTTGNVKVTEQARKTWSSSPTLSTLACLIALLSTFVNIYISFSTTRTTTIDSQSIQNRRRPSQFTTLSYIPYGSHPLLSDQFGNLTLTTFPTFIQTVSRSQPNRVYYNECTDPRRKFTRFGTISPEDRRIVVSEARGLSSIVQFRARDFGFEKCRLELHLDPKFLSKSSPQKLNQALDDSTEGYTNSTRRKDWLVSGDISDIQVWKLDTSSYIPKTVAKQGETPGYESHKFGWVEYRSLSYNSRPKRTDLLRSFDLGHMQRENETIISSQEFTCPEDSILSFEMTCVSPGCLLDIWQDKTNPIGAGLVLQQMSTMLQ